MSVPKVLFFVTKGSLGKVVAPPLVKAISVAFEGRLLVAQVSPAQLEIRKVYLGNRNFTRQIHDFNMTI